MEQRASESAVARQAAFDFRGRPPSRPLALEAAALAWATFIDVEPSCSSSSRGTEMSASSAGTCSPYPPASTSITRSSFGPACCRPGSKRETYDRAVVQGDDHTRPAPVVACADRE